MIETFWVHAPDGVPSGARRAGNQGAPILFVHGVGSTAAIWDYQLEALERRFACYAIELRGNGSAPSDPSPHEITREGFVLDVLAIADAASIERFHLVGCSLGGVVGFELWRRAAHRVASLTIVGSFAAYPNSTQYVDSVIAAATQAASMETFARARVERILPPGAPRKRIDETIDQMARKSLASYIASTKATWTGDYRSDLSAITVPALVICGELDPIAPLPLSQEIAGGLPHAELVVIPGASHVANADAPEAFNTELERFFEGLETSGAAAR